MSKERVRQIRLDLGHVEEKLQDLIVTVSRGRHRRLLDGLVEAEVEDLVGAPLAVAHQVSDHVEVTPAGGLHKSPHFSISDSFTGHT